MEKSFPLNKLIDLEELQSIQDSFSRAAGISSVILSPEGEPLTRFTNPTGLCSMIQSTEKGKEGCFRSVMKMGKRALESRKSDIFYCFAHSGNFVAPIVIDGEHKGTMFAGQFTPEKFSCEQLRDLKEIAVEIDLNPKLFVKEAEKMRVVDENVIRNYSSLLFMIVETIAKRGSQAAELIRAKNALQKSHDELERRVQERTAELAEANKELKHEIAERKLAKAAIRASEEKYRTIYDSSKDAIMTLTPEEGFLNGNPASIEMFGCENEKEFIAHALHDLSPQYQPDGALSFEKANQMMEIAMEKGSHLFEWTHKRIGGKKFFAIVLLTRMKLQQKKLLQATVRDITEQKTVEEENRKKTDELEKFNKLAVGRECKMIELKKEINALLEKLGKAPGYKIVGEAQGEVF